MKRWKHRSRPDLLRRLPMLCGKILGAEDKLDVTQFLVRDIHEVLEAETTGYNRIEPGRQVQEVGLSRDFDEPIKEAARHVSALDHELPRVDGAKDPRIPFYMSNVVEEVGLKEFRSRDIARYVYEPMGGPFVLVYHSKPIPSVWSTGVVVRRNVGFSDDEMRFMTVINQAVHSRLHALALAEQLQIRQAAKAEDGQQPVIGSLVTDRDGVVYRMSGAAPQILNRLGKEFPTPYHLPLVFVRQIIRAVQTGVAQSFALINGQTCRIERAENDPKVDLFHVVVSLSGSAQSTTVLTRRETEVARWVAEGKTNPEIAAILHISPRTVSKHLENILAKLHLPNRVALAAQWLERL